MRTDADWKGGGRRERAGAAVAGASVVGKVRPSVSVTKQRSRKRPPTSSLRAPEEQFNHYRMSTAGIVIRSLDERDLPAALAIQSEAYPSFLQESADAFASRLRVPATFCLAAISAGELVAYLLAHGWPAESPPSIGAIVSSPPSSEVLFIHDLAVGYRGRGLGLGRRLVKSAFELATHQGMTQAELIAVQGAAAYWRTLGFFDTEVSAELGAKIAAYGQDARWMTRKIPALDKF